MSLLTIFYSIKEKVCDEGTFLEIISADHTKLSAMITTAGDRDRSGGVVPISSRKRKGKFWKLEQMLAMRAFSRKLTSDVM